MQITIALLSSLALVATSLAAPEERAASFTTWNCNDCARNGGGSACSQKNHQDIKSETCFTLEPNQQSLVVDYAVRSSCYVQLYASRDCSGNGPTYNYDLTKPCRPIPANERSSYQVLCN
ncbi:hypothetical protein BKA66DRAFT_478685 [Pyrenochaeta sp. MPI-SDFR-AT-0127]|nr:hypothetical protein BKA66DRAFT_478685 [Pyrenochaeta sp. MPI-SDFR-AT-0127]